MKTYPTFLVALFVSGAIATVGFAANQPTSPHNDGSAYSIIKIVNKDQFQGKWKQFKGDLKKKWGKFTDDDLMQIEGDYDKYEGKVQERYGDRREELKKWTDDWFASHDAMGRPRSN